MKPHPLRHVLFALLAAALLPLAGCGSSTADDDDSTADDDDSTADDDDSAADDDDSAADDDDSAADDDDSASGDDDDSASGDDDDSAASLPVDADGDGASEDTDCDDSDPAVHPQAIEVCDGIDNNCDGNSDDASAQDASTWYLDGDGDGYGESASAEVACNAPVGYSLFDGDCDDTDPSFHPGASEPDCTDPNDYNCDNTTAFADADSDGFAACEDCDDNSFAINSDASEICNGSDDDCDGQIDEPGASGESPWFLDADGDGYGRSTQTLSACNQPLGYVDNDNDCDDLAPLTYPGAAEICDGTDNNCDTYTDEGNAAPTVWFADFDGDGYGNAALSITACNAPFATVADSTDCDDLDATSYPGATELCDGADNNCDTQIDEGVLQTFYLDSDGDGFGNPLAVTQACFQTPGTATNDTDCDDNAANVYPGANEVWDDGVDNNCINDAPEVLSVTVSPNPAFTGDPLNAVVVVREADGDSVTLSYSWNIPGVQAGISTTDTLPDSQVASGREFVVVVTPNDGLVNGTAVQSASITISNSAPTAPGVTISTTNPSHTVPIDCVVATPSSDADQHQVTYSYEWEDGNGNSLSGATLPSSATAAGEQWTCTVTPTDSEGLSGPSGQATVSLPGEVFFSATGSDQSWVVPPDVTTIQAKLWGAAGAGSLGESYSFPGGPGGFAKGAIPTTPGETLVIKVGVGGLRGSQSISNSYPAGGQAGQRSGYSAGGGGGRSAIERSDGTEMLVAGGGGGAGCTGWHSSYSTRGGLGGGNEGGRGYMSYCSCASGGYGRGGTQNSGGTGGSHGTNSPGSKNAGGNGLSYPGGGGNCGGGGGDGYYGGGAGSLHAGGGGGSGYASAQVSNPELLVSTDEIQPGGSGDSDYPTGIGVAGPNANGGDGYIVIRY